VSSEKRRESSRPLTLLCHTFLDQAAQCERERRMHSPQPRAPSRMRMEAWAVAHSYSGRNHLRRQATRLISFPMLRRCDDRAAQVSERKAGCSRATIPAGQLCRCRRAPWRSIELAQVSLGGCTDATLGVEIAQDPDRLCVVRVAVQRVKPSGSEFAPSTLPPNHLRIVPPRHGNDSTVFPNIGNPVKWLVFRCLRG
jgi:hypothetical protein